MRNQEVAISRIGSVLQHCHQEPGSFYTGILRALAGSIWGDLPLANVAVRMPQSQYQLEEKSCFLESTSFITEEAYLNN